MKTERVWAVYFSPTGSTDKIVKTLAKAVADGLGAELKSYNYTLPKRREQVLSFNETDLVIIATPVYAGRVPNKLLPFVQNNFKGNGAIGVPAVVFGNRSYDNGLIELRNEMENNGFHTVAGGAFVSRHCMSSVLAAGRPNDEDIEFISDFGAKIADKVKNLTEIPDKIDVKGDDPVGPYYTPLEEDGKPAKFLKAKPKTDMDKCDNCGACAKVCPMGSIDFENVAEVPGICIKCHACVRKCHTGAKYFDDPSLKSHIAMLEKNYARRAESEVFI